MKFRLITIVGMVGMVGMAAATLLVSCENEGASSHSDEAEDHASHSDSPSLQVGLDGVNLKNGQRWKMDDHTRSLFVEMEVLFLNADHQSLEGEGLRMAGVDLQVLVDDLIKGCTMTGAAHAQLHQFLSGYLPAVASLSNSGRIEDAKKVAYYLTSYDEYFE